MFLINLLKIKFNGFFNSNTNKKLKQQGYYNNTLNFFFFIQFFKKIIKGLNNKNYISIKFFKKKTFNFFFIKSNIRYKISKHVLQKLSNRFSIELCIVNNKKNTDFLQNNLQMFSAPYMNVNYILLNKTFKKKDFFII